MIDFNIGDKVLVTTSEWFVAPNGRTYQAVFGTVKGCFTAEETLGIKPNGKSTNWYLEIGAMIIAGCQIHYAIKTASCCFDDVDNWTADAASGIKIYKTPTRIYAAD